MYRRLVGAFTGRKCQKYKILTFFFTFLALFNSSIFPISDAHCECTEGWLEPLLAEIARNRKAVVCPIIDVISDETFEYVTASDMTWGGFNWKLNFRW